MTNHDPNRPWPNALEAEALGCTCEWISGGEIIRFDRNCPILEQHKGVPAWWLATPDKA